MTSASRVTYLPAPYAPTRTPTQPHSARRFHDHEQFGTAGNYCPKLFTIMMYQVRQPTRVLTAAVSSDIAFFASAKYMLVLGSKYSSFSIPA